MPVALKGSTSGEVTLTAPAVAGTNTITFPAATGTMALNLGLQLIRPPQYFASGTSYTTPADCTAILVEAWGGGGGGTGGSGGGGGGSGSYATKYFVVTPSTSYTYAIGAGGAQNVAGGNTTFGPVLGVTLTAGGGGTGSGQNGGAGGTATNADFSFSMAGDTINNTQGGNGGGSVFWGGAAMGRSTTYPGQNAKTYGGGGGGAQNGTGGAGFQGIIRITEFAS